MPVNDGSDIGQLEFRKTDVRYFRPRVDDQGTPFGRIVAAVFVALCLFGVLQLAIGVIVYRSFVRDMEKLAQHWEREAERSLTELARVASVPAPVRRQPAAVLPRYVGPIEARQRGATTACIGGRVSRRLPDGWDQSSTRCTATTQ